MEVWIDDRQHIVRLWQQLAAEEFHDSWQYLAGRFHQRRIVDLQYLHVPSVLQPPPGLVAVTGQAAHEIVLLELGAAGIQSLDHFGLRSDDFLDRPHHEDYFVAVPGWHLWQQHRNALDGFLVHLFAVQQFRSLANLFNFFPLVVALRIVGVGSSFSIDHHRHSSGCEHLHHQRRARAGQTGHQHELFP